MPIKKSNLDIALSYLALGWNPIPARGKKPLVRWKPYQKKRVTEADLRRWWGERPDADVAIITGDISGIVVLDADSPQAVKYIEKCGMPPTPQVRTGRGTHFYFKHPGGHVRNKVNSEIGLDVRADGGYVIAPPSRHPNGKRYEWAQPLTPWGADLEDLLPWMLEYLGRGKRTADKPHGWQTEALKGVAQGERNQMAARLAGLYIAKGKSRKEVEEILLTWNKDNKPPLSESEIITTVKSVHATHNRNEGVAKPHLEVAEEIPAHDDDAPAYVRKLNKTHAVVILGGKTVVLNEIINPVFGYRDVTFSTIQDFTNWYKNQKITMPDPDPDKEPKRIPVSKLWLESPCRRQYKGIVFDPSVTPEGYYNLWRGFAVKPRPGNWSLYENHIKEIICDNVPDNYYYVIAWMADIVQNPGGERPGVSLVLRGEPGVGKGVFATIFGKLFGPHFLHITNQNQLTGRFNNHLKDALVTFCDEAIWAGDKSAEGVLKGIITEEYNMVEQKGKDAFPVKNRIRLIVASNSEWVIPAGLGDRRFLVLDVGDGHRRDHEYFSKIVNQMDENGRAAMLFDLLHQDISNIDLRTYPATEALLEQKMRSMTPVQKFWFDTLNEGRLATSSNTWVTEISTELLYKEYKDFTSELGSRHLLTDSVFFKELKRLIPTGFVKQRKRTDKGRRFVYTMPPLEKCRTFFEKKLGSEVEWETLNPT